MKRTWALGLVVIFTLAGCAAPSSPAVQDPPAEETSEPTPEVQEYNPPPPPPFEGEAAETPEAKAIAAEVALAFSEAFEWPDAGPYPEVTGFYGTGSPPELIVQVVTTLAYDPAVEDPHALDLCMDVTTLWPVIGSPDGWNMSVIRSADGSFLTYCTNHATGP